MTTRTTTLCADFINDFAARFDIPELRVLDNDPKFINATQGAQPTWKVEFTPSGQFAAIVRSAEVRIAIGTDEHGRFYAGVDFSYKHESGSNGYSQRYRILTDRGDFGGPFKYRSFISANDEWHLLTEANGIRERLAAERAAQ